MADAMTIAERVSQLRAHGCDIDTGYAQHLGEHVADVYDVPAVRRMLTGALTERLVERGWGIYSGKDYVYVYKRPGEKVGFETDTLIKALLIAAEHEFGVGGEA